MVKLQALISQICLNVELFETMNSVEDVFFY